jgi:hypothetical protein
MAFAEISGPGDETLGTDLDPATATGCRISHYAPPLIVYYP